MRLKLRRSVGALKSQFYGFQLDDWSSCSKGSREGFMLLNQVSLGRL